MQVRIADADPTPPYEQLRKQFARLIQSGDLRAGDRLPPIRQLAADLSLAPGTVARTYRELEDAGLVVTRRGGGTRVAHSERLPAAADPVQAIMGDAVERALARGADGASIRAAVEQRLARAGIP